MGTQISLWVLFLIFPSTLLGLKTSVNGQCLDGQRSLLLQLRNSLEFDSSISTKLVQWDHAIDCCNWSGVKCDNAGHVTSLDLSYESINGGLNDSSSLFRLQFLQRLNLADNYFANEVPLPSGFGKLTRLTYLNLCNTNFSGQVPSEFSLMKRLVTLDLSTIHYYENNVLKLENPNLEMIVQNLTELQELYLDRVNISAPQGYDWSQTVSSSLLNLRVLSLSSCSLSRPPNTSLLKLKYLSFIGLDRNNFSSPFPEFFKNFSNLTVLTLGRCNLYGEFPKTIFQLSKLQTIDISENKLTGEIPKSITNLTQLVSVDFSHNRFIGSIPSFSFAKKLTVFHLSNNFLSGSIPLSLFSLPSLEFIDLSSNQLSGQMNKIANISSFLLSGLWLDYNQLEGPIPKFVFELRGLEWLSLSSNKFNGTVELSKFAKMGNLQVLLLYSNKFNKVFCRQQLLPDRKNKARLEVLDLSRNQISGEIPNCIWNISYGGVPFLNLSHNLFSSLQEPFKFQNHIFLDLNSNQLHGAIPLPPSTIRYVDYSSNNFTSSIPIEIGNHLFYAVVFSVSNNKISGTIPESICNASNYHLEVLDLSNNSFHGTIPSCLMDMSNTLGVLNLRKNNLSGNISGIFPQDCGLEILDLSENLLEGQVPESLTNCRNLQLLNLRNNKINDSFPCWLKNLPNLRVLVLRSNSFHGHLSCLEANYNWSYIQIIDLASNNFRGTLPPRFFLNLRAIVSGRHEKKLELTHLSFDSMITSTTYQEVVTISLKGQPMELLKIFTSFTSIDFSSNSFQGSIPETVGGLKSVLSLNFSHNALIGHIPPSVGNLKEIESLDLSSNKLSGVIPTQLASLLFLSFLNLSDNQLVGMIPVSTQLLTFIETSFQGNEGLCGVQLNLSCYTEEAPTLSPPTPGEGEFEGEIYTSAALGYFVGLGIIIWPLVFIKPWRDWCNMHLDPLLLRILNQQNQQRRYGRVQYRRPIRRLLTY